MRIGSLFSGYGGLDMAVQEALASIGITSEVVWHSDIKPAACALLKYRHPGVPNLGDLTLLFPRDPAVPAVPVAPIDIKAASWPCQPESSAGLQLGEDDPRALWPELRRGIAETRPQIFFGENVARIARNGSLRRVVQDLANLGYVGAWRVLGASDVYGCHQRLRCFVVAVDASADPDAIGLGPHVAQLRPREPDAARSGHLTLLPTPTKSMTTGAGTQGRAGGLNLQTAALKLLPTPTVTDARGGRNATAGRSEESSTHHDGWTLSDVAYASRWGVYEEAIARWDAVLGRTPPAPTRISPRNGKPQLNAPLVEWMMGLPEGWVCDVPTIAPKPSGLRNAALSLCWVTA